MGKAIKTYKIPRQKITIMTKCFRVVCDPENYDAGSGVTMQHDKADLSKDYVNQWGKKGLNLEKYDFFTKFLP